MNKKTDIYTSGEYSENAPDWHDYEGKWKAEQIFKLIEKYNIPQGEIVEVGCGSGRVLFELTKMLPDVNSAKGFDISSTAITMAKERYENDKITYFCENALDKYNDVSDIMVMMDVFEHVEDYMGFLKSFNRKSKKYIFHIPLDMHVLGLLIDHQISTRKRAGHLHYFSKKTALATMEDCGYRVIDFSYTKGALEIMNKAGNCQRDKVSRSILNIPRRIFYTINKDMTVKIFGGFSLLVIAEDI